MLGPILWWSSTAQAKGSISLTNLDSQPSSCHATSAPPMPVQIEAYFTA